MAAEIVVLARIVMASAVVLLLPGYLCALALFPWAPEQDFVQDVGAAGGLGLSISIIIGTFLTKSASGFHLISFLTVLAGCCICFAAAALIRNWPTERRLLNQLPVSQPRPHRPSSWFGLPVLGAMGLILTTVAIGEHLPRSFQDMERYTEFYVLDVQRLIPNSASPCAEPGCVRLTIGIINQEQAPADYRLEARMAEEPLWSAELGYVNHSSSWEQTVEFQLPAMDESGIPQLELLLFRSDETVAYRYLHLIISDEE